MIRNQWYAVLESREVKKNKLLGAKRMGERMLFWRDNGGQVHCLKDTCPHRGAQLSKGKLVDGHVQCPFHGLEFSGDGECVYIPSLGKAADISNKYDASVYPVRESNDFVYIFWGKIAPGQDLPPIEWVDDLPHDEFAFTTVTDHWKVDYSRVIENQLDVAHLWLVHHNTIGRGNRRVCDGPLAEWCCEMKEPSLLNVWVMNRLDDGKTPARRPAEVVKPERHAFLQLRMPNVWHNWISDDIRVLAAFVPIDAENSRMYFRFYQRIIKVPVLKELFLFSGGIGNLMIERQDKRVVETQIPKRSDLRIGEKLFPADEPILLYRRRRRELIEANEAEDGRN